MTHLPLLLLLLQPAAQTGGPVTIDDLMARVAENQDRAQDSRKDWIYQQDVLVRMHRSNGKLAREEEWKYLVTPTPSGLKRERQAFEGKYELKGKFISYDQPHHEYKGLDIDGDLISDIGEDFGNDKNSKDGISAELFPLTKKEQTRYTFKLEAHEDYRGTDAYRVTFRPKPGEEKGDWKGEAIIDAAEFQPIVVTTGLAWGIPTSVKVLLGTDISHLGFKINYKKVADGIWFPTSYGGEFNFKALFLYKRKVSLAVKNDEFKKTEVTTKIAYEIPE